MLRIVNIEELRTILSASTPLIDLQHQHDAAFDDRAKEWLAALEKALESNRILEVGEIASLRGIILSAERGVIPPGLEFHGRMSKRKIVEGAVIFAVRNATSLVTDLLRKELDRVGDAERMMRQLLAMANAKGLLLNPPNGTSHTDFLKQLWAVFSADQDLAPGTINVEGFVGPHDALVVLDRVLASDYQT